MSKTKYKYNPTTLTYEKHELGIKGRVLKFFTYLGFGSVFAIVFLMVFYFFFPSPKEKQLQRELDQVKLQYSLLDNRVEEMSRVMDNISERDNNIYRTIFEAEPIHENIRKASFGGANRYSNLEGFEYSDMMIETSGKIDKLAKAMYIQAKSFDEVYDMAMKKEKMLASIPAIMPVANKELKRVASGFGMRIHPILKYRKMHTGMDFTAKTGTEIYATGDGVVEKVSYNRRGYGKHVIIRHGFGYKTLYGHMNKYNVRVGQKVKRGDVLGYVGNTGLSSGPHLHYEVIYKGKKINPAHFYSNDLSADQYEEMIRISSTANQSFD